MNNAVRKGWESASECFRKAFSRPFNCCAPPSEDIFSLIYDVAKTPINLLIGAINQMITSIQAGINALINSVNKLSFTTPDWVPGIGGKTFGFNIPTVSAEQIPYLAQGGYVKPNTPQLAMIGDNRHQGEVVAPEDKLRQMAAEAVRMSSGSVR